MRHEDVAILDETEPSIEALLATDESFLMTYGISSARVYRLDRTPEKISLPGHSGVVRGLSFGPGGAWLASVGTDRKLRVWSSATGRQQWESADLPGSGQSVACSPDGQLLAAGDSDTKWISAWDAGTGRELSGLGTNAVGLNWSVQFTPDGRYLVTAGGGYEYEQGVEVWAIDRDGQPAPQRALQGQLRKRLPINAWSLTIAPDSRHLAFVDNPAEGNLAGLGGHHLFVWDLDSGDAPAIVTTNFIAGLQSASFAPDSRRLLFANQKREVVTLDLATSQELSRFSTLEHNHTRNSLDFPNLCLSPNGVRLAIASASGLAVDLWDPNSGQLVYSLPEQDSPVGWLAWSPDSRLLAAARSDGTIAIWNLAEIDKSLAGLGLNLQR
jgi:WD40 repeat protein